MDRREFFKTGAKAAAAGAAVAGPAGASQGAGTAKSTTTTANPVGSLGDPGASVVMKDFTSEDHRRRLENIGICTQKIRKCMREHLISNYLPAQCCYTLGEYPCRKPWEIGEYDEQELDRLKDHGIQVIQVFDDWNDSIRLFGGDKYSAVNPAGFRRFIEMAHGRGIKVLPYTSTGYIQRTDPDFRQEWSPKGSTCSSGYWDMARCSPSSPGWRAFLLPRMMRILDEYGADGIYIDSGYVSKFAATALGSIGRAAVQALMPQLKHRARVVRLMAARAFGAMGPEAEEAVPHVAELLKDEDESVRSEAVRALEKIGPAARDAVPALAEALKHSPSLREKAARALSAIGAEALPALVEMLKDRDSEVRLQALTALTRMGPTAEAAAPAVRELLGSAHMQESDYALRFLRNLRGHD